MKLEPRTGYLEAGAALTSYAGLEAWLEAGANLGGRWAAFARGYARPDVAGVMGGVRYTFGW